MDEAVKDVFEAADSGDLPKLIRALETDPGLVHCKNEDGYTPLHCAARSGHPEIARVLIRGGADVDALDVDPRYPQPIHTPLSLSVHNGHLSVVRVLVEAGADLQYPRACAINLAAQTGHLDVVAYLLDEGADHSTPDRFGKTPLHDAAGHGRTETARLLIERGADVNARETGILWPGQTPLHKASTNGKVETAQLLLACGADPNALDAQGLRPVDLADNVSTIPGETREEMKALLSRQPGEAGRRRWWGLGAPRARK